MKGRYITCANCGGHGLVASFSEGANWPDECADCGGSGKNWLYPSGYIARFYSGPFLGRATAEEMAE